MARKNTDPILNAVRRDPSGKVKVAITDVDGVLRGKVLHRDKFLSIAESGFGFCNVVFGWDCADACYDNTAQSKIEKSGVVPERGSADYTGWHTGYPDAQAVLDLDTFRHVPWDGDVPFFLADFRDARGKALDVCPRGLLKKVRTEAAEMGFSAAFAAEFEWFNFLSPPPDPAPITSGMFGYSLLRASKNSAYFNDLFDLLGKFGVPLEGLHTETGPGVYEAAILYDEILSSADRAVLFKAGVKEIAHRHGIVPSFMAKWNADLPGCGGHFHQSLWDVKRSKNLFHDARDAHCMSELMKSYLAGVLYGLPEVLPMYAPTVNSYKRLVEGAWAPTTPTWGVDNRTTDVRVLPGGPKSTRLEFRVAGADANPYLAMAANLACGLYGVRKKMKLTTPPTRASGYQDKSRGSLAPNLWEATQLMKRSDLARELFGEGFVRHFTQTREWEWRQCQKAVTDWELKRYFEII